MKPKRNQVSVPAFYASFLLSFCLLGVTRMGMMYICANTAAAAATEEQIGFSRRRTGFRNVEDDDDDDDDVEGTTGRSVSRSRALREHDALCVRPAVL